MAYMIKCTKCNVLKEQSEFFKDKQKKSGYRPDCKKCNTIKSVKWGKNNKDKRKWYMLKSSTGITKEQYNEMLDSQKGVCAICERSCSMSLAVDHDHKDNMVRGLLCNNCNRGLGHLKDDIENLERAINYLKNNNKIYEFKKK